MKKLNIGLFTDSYPPFINGVSTSVETLKKSLENLGHTVYVVTVGQDATTYHYNEEERILRIPGFPLGIYDYRVASIYPIKVINQIKSWKLDIIHSHTELCMGIFARLLAKQLNIPLIHTYHTMYKDYTHYVSRNHKYFDLGCKKAVEYLSKFYCDNTADAFIVPTIKTYRLFREEYHYEKDIYIVPTGIDATRFYEKNIEKEKVEKLRRELGYKKNDFVVIFVGRMAQEKNVEFLLRTMELLKKKKNIKLLLVGDGPDIEKYKKLANHLLLEESVNFIGRVSWEQMPYYYHCADVCISASKTETQGLTVIEAMASSLPAICIEDEAFHTMVVDRLNGRFFKEELECSKMIEELSQDKKQITSLSKQAIVAAKKFSLEEFAKGILEVYQAATTNHENKKNFTSIFTRILKSKRKGKTDEKNISKSQK